MVSTYRKISLRSASIFTSLFLTVCAANAANPTYITINNQTDLALGSQLSTAPGLGIGPSISKPFNYSVIYWTCYYSGNLNRCPIEFNDKSNGAKVATVYLNAETATLTEAPTLYGEYANKYEVRGWEASPLSEITITNKA